MGQPGDTLETVLLRRGEAEIDIALVAGGKRLAALETVQALRHGSPFHEIGIKGGIKIETNWV